MSAADRAASVMDEAVATAGSSARINSTSSGRPSLALPSSSTTMPLASTAPSAATTPSNASFSGATALNKPKANASSIVSTTVPSSSGNGASTGTSGATPASPKKKLAKKLANASLNNNKASTVRINFSLSENPNAIISFSDLFRQDQKRRIIAEQKHQLQQQIQQAKHALSSSAKKEAKAAAPAVTATTASSTTTEPMEVDPIEPSASSAVATSASAATAADTNGSKVNDGDSDDGAEEEASDDDEEDAEAEEEEDASDEDEDEDEDEEAEDDEGDDEDDEAELRERPGDFLEALAAKYAALEEFENDGEDEDDEDEEEDVPRTHKKPSRWDTERYDVEDEFIDDSEMMLEDIGMVKPKIEGFFVYRGPLETTIDEDSSDAVGSNSRSRKPAKRRGGVATSRSSGIKKSSTLSIMERANDSVSEMSEADEGKVESTPGKRSAADKDAGDASESSTKKKAAGSRARSGLSREVTSQKSTSSTTKEDNTAPGGTGVSTPAAGAAGSSTSSAAPTSGASVDKATPSTNKRKPKAKATAVAGGADSENDSSAKAGKLKLAGAEPTDDNAMDLDASSAVDMSHDAEMSYSSDTGADAVGTVSPSTSDTRYMEHARASSPSKAAAAALSKPTGAAKPRAKVIKDTEKKKATKSAAPLTAEVQRYLNIIADLAKKESWEVKNKFPPHIKPPLWEATKAALRDRSSGYLLDESFIDALMEILPYNRFTIRKLLYRNVLPVWIPELEEQKKKLEEKFDQQVKRVWRESGYEDKERKRLQELGVEGDVVMKSEGTSTETGEENTKPAKKFPWTQELRLLLWEVMEKHMEILAAMAQLNTSDPTFPVAPSDSKTRKDAYQHLVASFPPGWETTYGISRQYSQLKEKIARQMKGEQAANGGGYSGNSNNNNNGGNGQPRSSSGGDSGINRGNASVSKSTAASSPSPSAAPKSAPSSAARSSAPITANTSHHPSSDNIQTTAESSSEATQTGSIPVENVSKIAPETIDITDDDEDMVMEDVRAEPGGMGRPGTAGLPPKGGTAVPRSVVPSASHPTGAPANRPPHPGHQPSHPLEQQHHSMAYQSSHHSTSHHRTHGLQKQSSMVPGSSSPPAPAAPAMRGHPGVATSTTAGSGWRPSSSVSTASEVPFDQSSTPKKRKNSREEQYIAAQAAAAAKESAALRAAHAQHQKHRQPSPAAASVGRAGYDDRTGYSHHPQQQHPQHHRGGGGGYPHDPHGVPEPAAISMSKKQRSVPPSAASGHVGAAINRSPQMGSSGGAPGYSSHPSQAYTSSSSPQATYRSQAPHPQAQAPPPASGQPLYHSPRPERASPSGSPNYSSQTIPQPVKQPMYSHHPPSSVPGTGGRVSPSSGGGPHRSYQYPPMAVQQQQQQHPGHGYSGGPPGQQQQQGVDQGHGMYHPPPGHHQQHPSHVARGGPPPLHQPSHPQRHLVQQQHHGQRDPVGPPSTSPNAKANASQRSPMSLTNVIH